MTKTFDKKDVYSWANAEEARQYIGQFGYFCDCCVKNAEEWGYGKLTQIYTDNSVNETFYLNDGYSYGLFIPAEKVKEVEETKKYRPFLDVYEFLKFFKLGDVIHLKKCSDLFEITGIFTSYRIFLEYYEVVIGVTSFLLNAATMNDFQIEINGKWQPFGVEVEE